MYYYFSTMLLWCIKHILSFQNIKKIGGIYIKQKISYQLTIFILEKTNSISKTLTFYINKWEVHNEGVLVTSICLNATWKII